MITAVVLVGFVVAVLMANYRLSTADVVLMAYLLGGYLLLHIRSVLVHRQIKPLLTEVFVPVDVEPVGIEANRRQVAVRLPDGHWLAITSRTTQPPLVAQRRLWVLRHGDRARVLLPGAGLLKARIRAEPLRDGARPPQPPADAWEAAKQSANLRVARRKTVVFALTTALLAWARLGYPHDDRSLFAIVLTIAPVLTAVRALQYLIALIGMGQYRRWSEFAVEPDPVISDPPSIRRPANPRSAPRPGRSLIQEHRCTPGSPIPPSPPNGCRSSGT
ncbi:hypothetical protein ABZU76_07255 [Amycolatopsis sp. NPDC005232]|uniref:hypothetical protein n=1 Tax=Amycolatopsis sp. NPDC005232 TaxID=3157027 RepID=UPI0033A7FC69